MSEIFEKNTKKKIKVLLHDLGISHSEFDIKFLYDFTGDSIDDFKVWLIENYIKEIRAVCDEIGWSLNKLFSSFYIDKNDVEDDNDIDKFVAKEIKSLQRKTYTHKKIINLRNYIYFIKGTDEYKKAKNKIENHNDKENILSKIHEILEQESDDENKKIIEVAASQAFAIGESWNFNVFKYNCNDSLQKYIVTWDCDLGYNYGSGTWCTILAEISQGTYGKLYIENIYKNIEIGLRYIEKIEAYDNEILTIIGCKHDKDDSSNLPTLKYRNKIKKINDEWHIISSEYIGKHDYSYKEEDLVEFNTPSNLKYEPPFYLLSLTNLSQD